MGILNRGKVRAQACPLCGALVEDAPMAHVRSHVFEVGPPRPGYGWRCPPCAERFETTPGVSPFQDSRATCGVWDERSIAQITLSLHVEDVHGFKA